MDYTNDTKEKDNNDIQVKDMVQFMCDYIRDDQVGLIASAHLAWADTIGIFSETCMTLAKKYSVTLDFAKSGKPEKLASKERVQRYPDFMEKFREKDSYLSTNALGYLFRNCKKIEIVANILSTEEPVHVDQTFVFNGWEAYRNDAEKSLLEYIHLFSTPTRLFHLTNEGEIMSGAIKKLEKTFQGKNIEKNISKMLETVIPHVLKKMKNEFYREFLNDELAKEITRDFVKEEDKLLALQNHMFLNFKWVANKQPIEETPLLTKMLQKASAWYVVAYESKQDGSSLFLGLPWVVPEFMGILCAKNKGKEKPNLEMKIQSFLDSQKNEMESFLKEKPFGDQVELSKQIMRRLATHLGYYLSVDGAGMKCLHQLMNYEILLILKEISKSDDSLKVTTEHLIYKYLISFADSYTNSCSILDEQEDSKETGMRIDKYIQGKMATQQELKKELGVIAIITLSLLSSTGKLWILDMQDLSKSSGVSNLGLAYLTKEYREEIRFPLNMEKRTKQHEDGSSFKDVMLRNTSEIAELMQRFTRLSLVPEIDFKEPKAGSWWYVLVSVYGRPFSIEKLKDLIVQPGFDKKVKRAVSDDCCIM